jgi:hypothetical protein
LPKHERYGRSSVTVLRAHVDPVPESAASSFELTHFGHAAFWRWLHRLDSPLGSPCDRAPSRRVRGRGPTLDEPGLAVLEALIREALATYQGPLDRLTTELETVESSLLGPRLTEALEQVFVRKRRASALAWQLLWTREILLRVQTPRQSVGQAMQALREDAETLHFRAREAQLLERRRHDRTAQGTATCATAR